MLRKRVIFTLVYSDGFFNQSRNFRLQKVGNIAWLENNYKFREIAFSLDELVVLNATRGDKNLADFSVTLSQLVDDVFIPITAGGGIRSFEDAKLLFDHGADKVIVNTTLSSDKQLIKDIVEHYGKQSIMASIDYDKSGVLIADGTQRVELSLADYIVYVESLGVGEIYLNSIEKDGTGFGYDLEVVKQVSEQINVPLIIAGGAGNKHHLLEGINLPKVSAAATANLFNFMGNGLPDARAYMIEKECNLVNWL